MSEQLRAMVGAGGRGSTLGLWALTLAAVGLLVGGGAALVLVLVHVAADARRRPYIYLAPALAAFSACILVGLDARLPLASISAEHLAVFALVVAVVGGALMQDPRSALQITGLILTLWPPVCLLIIIWAATGKGDPAVGLWTLAPEALGYLVILTVSSFAIASVALVARSVEANESNPPSDRQSTPGDRHHLTIDADVLKERMVRASATLSSTLQHGVRVLHKPLLVAFGVALAVGVVRAIVGASGNDGALAPALIEPVSGPVVESLVTPTVEPAPTAGKIGASAEAVVETRRLARAQALEARLPRIDGHGAEPARSTSPARAVARAPRHRGRVRAKAIAARDDSKEDFLPLATTTPASAAARTPIDPSAWGQDIAATPAPTASARARLSSRQLASAQPSSRAPAARAAEPATPALAQAVAAPTPTPPPSPAPKPAAAAPRDETLDALMNDVLSVTK